MPEAFGTAYMMAAGAGTNFQVNTRNMWEVQFDGIDCVLHAQDCTPPKYDIEKIAVSHMNEETKYAGKATHNDIRVTLLDVIAPDIFAQLWSWMQLCYNSVTGMKGYAGVYKKNGVIRQYDVTGLIVIRTFFLYGLFITASPVSDESFDYNSHEPVKLALVLSCDRSDPTGLPINVTA